MYFWMDYLYLLEDEYGMSEKIIDCVKSNFGIVWDFLGILDFMLKSLVWDFLKIGDYYGI